MLQLSLASLNGYDTVVDHSPRSFFLAKGGKLFTCKSITPPSNLGMVPVCGAVKHQEQDGGNEEKGCGWAWRASEFMPDDEKPKVSDMASQAYILSEIYINLQRSSQIQADIPKN